MHPTILVRGKTYTIEFRTSVFATGIKVNADSTPTYTVRKNGSTNGDSVTITNPATGLYSLSYNPSGEVEGDFFSIDIAAIISTVEYNMVINFTVTEVERGTDGANTTAPDNAGISTAAAAAVSAASSAGTASTNTTSLLAKFGEITGSGINTLLGILKAIIRADATVPSDIGGTMDPSADSLEALGEGIAGLGSNLGRGADQCTIRIRKTDTTPVADADVWITTDSSGTNVIAGTRQTNSSGKVTFLLDAGETYYLWAQKDGWEGIQGGLFIAVAD